MKPVFDKKKQLTEQIFKILEGKPTGDAKYSLKQIELLVEQQLAYQMKINLFSNYKIGEAINPGQYLTTFEDVPVKTNTGRNRDYINLPARFVDLPGGKGVWSVGPMGNDYDKFIPLKSGAANFSKVFNTPFLQGNIGFEVEGLKVYFSEKIINDIENCLVQLVTPDSVDINITADMDVAVIGGVLQILSVEAPSDKINDNSEAK
jgi:hypothetical protein